MKIKKTHIGIILITFIILGSMAAIMFHYAKPVEYKYEVGDKVEYNGIHYVIQKQTHKHKRPTYSIGWKHNTFKEKIKEKELSQPKYEHTSVDGILNSQVVSFNTDIFPFYDTLMKIYPVMKTIEMLQFIIYIPLFFICLIILIVSLHRHHKQEKLNSPD